MFFCRPTIHGKSHPKAYRPAQNPSNQKAKQSPTKENDFGKTILKKRFGKNDFGKTDFEEGMGGGRREAW